MRNYGVVLLAWLLLSIGPSCFSQEIRPLGIAITVEDLERSAAWYRDVFEMETYKELDFPSYDSLRIHFLRNGSFELELMEKATSFSIQEHVPDYNISRNPLLGFSKVAFRVDNIDSIYDRISKLGVREFMGLTRDKVFNSTYFIIQDPDGNILQFIEQND